jgi:SAM-dependent methyltransferase
MLGRSFEEKIAEQKALIEEALQGSRNVASGALAVDLGCGPGYQSVALAQMGFNPVIAIDTSAALLDELRSRSADLPIQVVEDDLLHLGDYVDPHSVQVVACMGDTLTHLQSQDAVEDLLRSAFKALVPGGVFICTYRDLSHELYGLDRFIPVRSDDERAMTCFLEFDREESVMVHDLVYVRESPSWHFEKSSYRKLRLPVEWLQGAMASIGFEVNRGSAGRLVQLVGKRQ